MRYGGVNNELCMIFLKSFLQFFFFLNKNWLGFACFSYFEDSRILLNSK